MARFLYLLTLLFLSLACGTDDDCSMDRNCADYSSQAEAQEAMERNPFCRADLDADNDCIACEDWVNYYQNGGSGGGGNGGGCPNTSACGCSGHNKSPCQADPCCRWTVGQGCGCR